MAGLINCVPRFNGKFVEPHCLLVGGDGFLPGKTLGCLDILMLSLSLLKLRALWEFSSPSSSSSLFIPPAKISVLEGDLLPVDNRVGIRPGKDEATKLAAAREFTEAATIAAAE